MRLSELTPLHAAGLACLGAAVLFARSLGDAIVVEPAPSISVVGSPETSSVVGGAAARGAAPPRYPAAEAWAAAEAERVPPARTREARRETTEEAPDPPPPPPAVQIVGTVVHLGGGQALLQLAGGEQRYVEQGGRVDGYRLAAVEQDGVVFETADGQAVRVSVTEGAAVAPSASSDLSWRTSPEQLRLQTGQRLLARCPPNGSYGPVWGNNSYTSDSSICTAAVHAGILTAQRGGLVLVTALAGRESYQGSQRNGVSTQPFGSYQGSFSVSQAANRDF